MEIGKISQGCEIRSARKENIIKATISKIGKKIFSYLRSIQPALAAGVGSYVCIEVGRACFSFAESASVYSYERCQDTICQYWHNDTQARTTFSSTVALHCNSSSPNYDSFDFFYKCIHELCRYMNKIGRNLSDCLGYQDNFDITDKVDDAVDNFRDFWEKFCPKRNFNQMGKAKQDKYLQKCLKRLCSSYNNLWSEDNIATDVCSQFKIEELNKAIKILKRKLKKNIASENMTESSLKTASLAISIASASMSILSGITSITSAALTIYTTRKAAALAKANFPLLKKALNEMLTNIADFTKKFIDIPMNIRVIGLEPVSEFVINIQRISQASQESEGSFYEDAMEEPLESSHDLRNSVDRTSGDNVIRIGSGNAGDTLGSGIVVGAGSVIGMASGGGGAKLVPSILDNNPDGAMNGSIIKATKLFTSTVQSSLNIPFNETVFSANEYANLTENHLEVISEYADYLMAANFFENRLETQLHRIKHSLNCWENSLCIYERAKLLFCRPNLYRNTVEIPFAFLREVVLKNESLCYELQSGIWCNWDQIFKSMAEMMGTFRNRSTLTAFCPWDHVVLSIEHYNRTMHKINATGMCYQEILYFK